MSRQPALPLARSRTNLPADVSVSGKPVSGTPDSGKPVARKSGGGVFRRPRAGLAILSIIAVLGFTFAHPLAAKSPAPRTVPEASPTAAEVLGPGRGLARAAADRKPIFLLVVPASAVESTRAWQEDLGKSTQKRLTKEFIFIEVILTASGQWPKEEPAGENETPVPWQFPRAKSYLESRLGVLGESPVLAIFDFSGVLLARDDGDFPKDSKLRKALKAALIANQKAEKVFGEVEKGAKIIGLAMKKKKYPDACRAYAAIQGHEIPLDSAPAIARAERYRELKAEFEKQRAVAEKLEKDEDYASAVSQYEQVLAEFPLREWQDELRNRIGILWRKIYGGTGGVGGGTGGGGR